MDINSLRGMYTGQSCFLICDGPSFSEVDKSLLSSAGIVTMGVNNSPKSFRPNLWCAVDPPSRWLESIKNDGKIIKFVPTSHRNKYKSPNIGAQVNLKFNEDTFLSEPSINYGCSKEEGGGRSVMLFAIKVLYVLGFKNVFLLGVDFEMVEGEENYHFNENTSKCGVKGNNNTYRKLQDRFDLLLPKFIANNFNLYNCNINSKLKTFPYMSLDDALVISKEGIPDTEEENTLGLYKDAKRDKKSLGKTEACQKRISRGGNNKPNDGIIPEVLEAGIDVTNCKNQIAILGMSRSGTHAISDWVCTQLGGNVEWRNDLNRRFCDNKIFDPDNSGVPERWYSLATFRKETYTANNMDNLVYTYENLEGKKFDVHRAIRSETKVKAVILRDPINLLCSLARQLERGSKFWFYQHCTDQGAIKKEKLSVFADMWMSHARLYEDDNNVVGINYNKWCEDEGYRNELFDSLKLDSRTDKSMSNVSVNGGGSSFDKLSMNGDASKMNTCNRWKEFEDQEWLKHFIAINPELMETSKRIFGDILDA